ncbi:methyltransferase domain-containing protein [Sphingobacterium sp. LRF_L2]|uniref:methyltransferase domain-containing protein n=1 Tax=Sphingobacterium sp. LRF_L2 TaxID=3369421 RepID=UPI003F61CBC7
MSEKHYNINYLKETVKILGGVKQNSYEYFKNISLSSTIVDLGCGIGKDLINMANLFADQKHQYIGVDHDENMIQEAAKSAEQMEGVRFLKADVLQLPFENGAIAGVRMERLVQHVSDPIGLFDEVHRVLQEGGITAIVESDWDSLTFYNGNLAVADQLNRYLVAKKVNNGRAAQSLTNYLLQTKFSEISVEVWPFVLTKYDEACNYLWIDKMINEMLTLNLIDQQAHDDFIEAQKNADRAGFFSCSMNIVIVSGRK